MPTFWRCLCNLLTQGQWINCAHPQPGTTGWVHLRCRRCWATLRWDEEE